MSAWQELGKVAPAQLGEARMFAHWACQLPSAVGSSWLPPREDFSHTNLGWNAKLGALTSRPLDATSGLQAGLRVADLHLIVAREDQVVRSLDLRGQTLDDALAWLGTLASELPDERAALSRPQHDMPAHELGEGAPFSLSGTQGAPAELARWMANFHGMLGQTAAKHEGATELRLWPHHFDMATLIPFDPGASGEDARSVNVGLSLGDGSYDEPYVYVSPWPYPNTAALPVLPAGHWHTEGFIAAILPGSELVARDDQAEFAAAFIERAIEAARASLG